MSIKLMIDSGSDITSKEAKELGVLFVPIEVRFGDEVYLDGENLVPEEFYSKLESAKELPKTSLINEYRWEEEFSKATQDGSEVVAITLSSGLSGTYSSALEASKKFGGKVYVVDSMNAAIGERLLLQYAIELLKSGRTASEISEELERVKGKIVVTAMVGTLKYLKMGGRISATTAFVGEMLSIKPLVALIDGKVKQTGKAIGVKKAFSILKSGVIEKGGIDFNMPFGFVWSGNDQTEVNKFIECFSDILEERDYDKYLVGSTIGTHVGPGAVGIAFFQK